MLQTQRHGIQVSILRIITTITIARPRTHYRYIYKYQRDNTIILVSSVYIIVLPNAVSRQESTQCNKECHRRNINPVSGCHDTVIKAITACIV